MLGKFRRQRNIEFGNKLNMINESTVGFIGLGAMGAPMAIHLAERLPAETKIYAFDVVQSAVDQLVEQFPNKVIATKNARDVAERSVRLPCILGHSKTESNFPITQNIIFSMVPEGAHIRSVYLHPETGICTTDINNKLLIDCSTIDTATSLDVKAHIEKNFPSAFFYDAPVSGGVIGAKKGTIAFFLGCAEDDGNIQKISTLLKMMGKQIIPCGGPSLGLAAKLSNNYLSGVIAIACSEAFDMGMRSGLDPRVLARVYAAGTAQNTICDRFCPVPGVAPEAPSTKGYKDGFKVQLMRKDFGLAVDMAKRVNTKLVLGEAGFATYQAASQDPRCKDLDSRVVYRYLGGDEDWEKRFK